MIAMVTVRDMAIELDLAVDQTIELANQVIHRRNLETGLFGGTVLSFVEQEAIGQRHAELVDLYGWDHFTRSRDETRPEDNPGREIASSCV